MKSFSKRQFYKMLFPGTMTFVAFIAQQLSDIIIGGQFIGEDAITGISIMSPVIYVGIFLSGLVPYGAAILYNHEMGRFNNDEASKIFSNSLIISVVLTLVEVIIFTFFLDNIIAIFHPTEVAAYYAKQYFMWYRYAICLYPVFDLFDNMIFADGDNTLSSIANTTLMIFNIGFSALLSYTHGVWGIGFATFCSYVLCILIQATHFFKKSNSIHFTMYFSFKESIRTIIITLPHSSEYLFKACMLWFLNLIMINNYGEDGILVLSSAVALINLFEIFGGVAESIKPILGIYHGEENTAGMKKAMSLAKKAAVFEGILIGVIIFIFAPAIPKVLGITTEHILQLSIKAVRIVVLGAVFDSIKKLFTVYYSVMLHPEISIIMGGLQRVVFPCALSVLLMRPLGMTAIWVALMLSAFLTLVVTSVYLCVRFGKKRYPMLLEQKEKIRIFDCTLNPENITALVESVSHTIDKEKNSAIENNNSGSMPAIEESAKAIMEENTGDENKVILENKKNLVLLAIEESAVSIMEENAGNEVLAEYDIWLSDKPKIIIRYDGKLKDITIDESPTSIARYTFSRIQTVMRTSSYLISASQNRVLIEF